METTVSSTFPPGHVWLVMKLNFVHLPFFDFVDFFCFEDFIFHSECLGPWEDSVVSYGLGESIFSQMAASTGNVWESPLHPCHHWDVLGNSCNTCLLWFFGYGVGKIERRSSASNAFWQNAERAWPTLFNERLEYLWWRAIGKGGKGTIMVRTSILIHWECTSSAPMLCLLRFVHKLFVS